MQIAAIQCQPIVDDAVVIGDAIIQRLQSAVTETIDLIVVPEAFSTILVVGESDWINGKINNHAFAIDTAGSSGIMRKSILMNPELRSAKTFQRSPDRGPIWYEFLPCRPLMGEELAQSGGPHPANQLLDDVTQRDRRL